MVLPVAYCVPHRPTARKKAKAKGKSSWDAHLTILPVFFRLDRAILTPHGAVIIHLRGLVEKLEGVVLGVDDGVCSLLRRERKPSA